MAISTFTVLHGKPFVNSMQIFQFLNFLFT